MTRAFLTLAFVPMAWGAPDSSSSCISCHRAQAATQPQTSMARALQTAAGSEILRSKPILAFREGAYNVRISREGDRTLYTVTDGHETLSVPLQWAFGLGSAGQTYVYERNGNWYESRVSYYTRPAGLDVTVGHHSHPATLEEAAGRQLSVVETRACFNCHATNALPDGKLRVEGMIAGVQCERCHGPAGRHVAAMKTGAVGAVKDAAMRPLGKLTTDEMSGFCGACHRTWAQTAMAGPHDLNNVRFQPYRLTNSRCYDTADRRISCVACHDPHREVERVAAVYDARCLACHGAGAAGSPTSQARVAKRCPSSVKDCVTCHMPKIELPGAHNLFTDHQIRVVKPGDPYPT